MTSPDDSVLTSVTNSDFLAFDHVDQTPGVNLRILFNLIKIIHAKTSKRPKHPKIQFNFYLYSTNIKHHK